MRMKSYSQFKKSMLQQRSVRSIYNTLGPAFDMKRLKLPKFKSEAQERAFWSKIKLNDYFEPGDFKPVSFPNLKPSSNPISIRLPSPLLFRLKERANELGVPYQALIKSYLAERTSEKR